MPRIIVTVTPSLLRRLEKTAAGMYTTPDNLLSMIVQDNPHLTKALDMLDEATEKIKKEKEEEKKSSARR